MKLETNKHKQKHF